MEERERGHTARSERDCALGYVHEFLLGFF